MPGGLDPTLCRERQRRLLVEMQRLSLDGVLVTSAAHVQWLTGVRFAWLFEPAALLHADGTCVLVAPHEVAEPHAADRVLVYVAKRRSTVGLDQREQAALVLRSELVSGPGRRWGVEFSCCPPHLLHLANGRAEGAVDIDPLLWQLRRRKLADELALLRRAIDATGAMYARARELVRPGVNELDVFNDLQGTAVRFLGEPLTGTGNDYACGARGGPPRDRAAQAGELYILDLGPAYRGYFADTCRTLAVDSSPTDAQLAAWERVMDVFGLIERTVRPGVRCRDVFFAVHDLLDAYMPGSFNHHLGHGIGLFPHEAPHLNPNWDEVFEEGDVFTAEPGLYAPELRAGLRLENDYLVTASGVERLSPFPLEL
jgi:Xaa-Pro aminopeptidase